MLTGTFMTDRTHSGKGRPSSNSDQDSMDLRSLLEQVASLERRLQRERAARADAERIAEKGIRELYDRQQQLVLLQTMATAANQAKTAEEAMATALEVVCGYLGWPLGHVYRYDPGLGQLVSTGLWSDQNPDSYASFRKATESLTFSLGEGLPGRVLEERRPHWSDTLQTGDWFLRASEASEQGFRSAFAFPLMVGDEIVAVLEFFNCESVQPRDELLEIVALVGVQIGRAVERARSNERLQAAHDELEKRVEERTAELALARDQALESSRAKSAFLANMSHEIRTPMNGVLGVAELLLESPLTNDQRVSANIIRTSAESLLTVINDILDFSKIEAGKPLIQPEAFELRPLLEDVIDLVFSNAQAKRLEIILDIEPWLPTTFFGEIGRAHV